MRRVRPSTTVAANRLENWDRMGYDANLEIRTATAELLEKKVPFLPSGLPHDLTAQQPRAARR